MRHDGHGHKHLHGLLMHTFLHAVRILRKLFCEQLPRLHVK